MGLSSLVKKIASAASKAAKKYSSNKRKNKRKNKRNNSSSGYYDKNKDYAAAIKNTRDAAEKARLVAERQNKLDYMNATGQNKKGYTNSIYNGSTSSGSSGGSYRNSSGSGYFDSSKDYAGAIRSAKDAAERARLVTERQNKLDYMNATGQNKKGYTNSIYNGSTSSGSSGGSYSSGYFDGSKDYAGAIRSTKDAAERARLVAERQNKLNWMNATGQNKSGYSNSIYNNQTSSSFGNNTVLGNGSNSGVSKLQKETMDSKIQSTLAAMEKNSQLYSTATSQEQAKLIAENQAYTEQLKKLGVIPFQKDGRYYYNRPDDQTNETEGTYSGDSSLSLPDLALLRQYQTAYNDAKAKGDPTGMQAAHQMAEKLRDNYRYYPTKNSNGYGLGQNDIGFIRDMTARVDSLGNRYVDEYNKNTVTTKSYDANGNLRYTNTSGNIDGHNARVAEEIARTNSILAAQGKENNTYAVRVSDPNDLSLSNDALRSQYGINGGLMNYSGEYYTPQAAQAVHNTHNSYEPRAAQQTYDSGYNDIADYLEQARNAQLKEYLAQIEQQKSQNNLSFDEIARQAYIANRQSQMNLPQQLTAMGISGGASETAQLGLATNYQNNLNSNEQARQQMVQQMASSALQAKLQADSDISGYYADAQKSALAAYQQQQAQDQSYNQWLQQFQYQQQQDSLDREWQQTQLNNSLSQYQDSLKQQQLELALQLGDYSKLKAAGYDTSALSQAANSGARVYSGGGSSGGTNSNYKVSDENTGKTSIANKNGNGWVFVSGFGQLSNADLLKYVNNGAIEEVNVPDGKGNINVYYTANRLLKQN